MTVWVKGVSVPVIPGKDGATIPNESCVACGATNTRVNLVWLGIELGNVGQCVDFRACISRFTRQQLILTPSR